MRACRKTCASRSCESRAARAEASRTSLTFLRPAHHASGSSNGGGESSDLGLQKRWARAREAEGLRWGRACGNEGTSKPKGRSRVACLARAERAISRGCAPLCPALSQDRCRTTRAGGGLSPWSSKNVSETLGLFLRTAERAVVTPLPGQLLAGSAGPENGRQRRTGRAEGRHVQRVSLPLANRSSRPRRLIWLCGLMRHPVRLRPASATLMPFRSTLPPPSARHQHVAAGLLGQARPAGRAVRRCCGPLTRDADPAAPFAAPTMRCGRPPWWASTSSFTSRTTSSACPRVTPECL